MSDPSSEKYNLDLAAKEALKKKEFPAQFAMAVAQLKGGNQFTDAKARVARALGMPLSSVNRWFRIALMLRKNEDIYASVRDVKNISRLLERMSVDGLSKDTLKRMLGDNGVTFIKSVDPVSALKQEVAKYPDGIGITPVYPKAAPKLLFFTGYIEKEDTFLIPLSPACYKLGLDVVTQTRKINNAPWGKNAVVAMSDGLVYLDARVFPMWIATINPMEVQHASDLVSYQTYGVNAIFNAFRMTAGQSAPVDARLAHIDAVLMELQDKINSLHTAKLPTASGNFSFLKHAEVKGSSATGIAEAFSKKIGETFTKEDVKVIAVGLGIIDDDHFGGWYAHATEAHGSLRNKHWRFNYAGEEAVNNFLEYYMARAEPLVDAGTCKKKSDILHYLLANEIKRIGKGTWTQLTKEFPIESGTLTDRAN